MKKIVIVIVIAMFILILFYVIFPKYHFLSSNIFVIRCNKITGKMDYFNLIKEFKKQHPVIDFRPSKDFYSEEIEGKLPPNSPKNE